MGYLNKMNCSVYEPIALGAFAIFMLASNMACWRTQKLAKLDGYAGPLWKLLLGDVALPKSVLSDKGLAWRKASIVFFILLVASGVALGFLNLHESQCFGLNS